MSKTLIEGHRLTNIEKQRRFLESHAKIDETLENARASIDWKRRHKAERSLETWVKTYCVGLLLDDAPSKHGCEVLNEMHSALDDSRPYMIMMGRGSGKTSYVECASVYAIATGKRQFAVVVSSNARQASNILGDIFRIFLEPDTPFAQDYPDLCVPMQEANGSYRRRQTYKDIPTEIQKTSGRAVFARLTQPDGTLPTSGAVIATLGISSGIRGLKHRTMRPDLIILDDLQTSEDAENQATVDKLLGLIKKDILNLSGKGKLAVLQTATPITPDDLTDRISADKNWKTTRFPAMIKWPEDIVAKGDDGLWGEYFRIYDQELTTDEPHKKSLEFYKANREAMDEGAEVFNPKAFKKSDGHISAIQALLEKRHLIGDDAFAAEMQMRPRQQSFALNISPKGVLGNISGNPKSEVPDGYVFVAAATDLNVSYAASTVVTAFKPDMTSIVLAHFLVKCHIDQLLPETQYNQAVYKLLSDVGQKLKATGMKFDGWAIDSGGRNWEAVCQYTKQSMMSCGIRSCAFAGRAAHIFNPFVRTRLREAIGRTVLCGDAKEHIKAGSGCKYVFFDADLYKELAQRAFLSEAGSPGSCSLYSGTKEEHSDFALQFCNERLLTVGRMSNGKSQYTWKSKDPHDYLDCMSMCYAVAASQGISASVQPKTTFNDIQKRKRFEALLRKPKVKLV